jgi:hypothetical protein
MLRKEETVVDQVQQEEKKEEIVPYIDSDYLTQKLALEVKFLCVAYGGPQVLFKLGMCNRTWH